MSPLLRRAAASAGLAVCGWSTLLLAQSTTVAMPPDRGIRRLPTAPLEQAPPVVQQSPNGLYKLSITDTGIELRGPKGTVTINDGGITIGGPGSQQVSIETASMSVRVDRDATYRVGQNFSLTASSNLQIRGMGSTDVSGAGTATFTGAQVRLGCPGASKPAARLGDQVGVTASTGTGAILQGSPTVLVC